MSDSDHFDGKRFFNPGMPPSGRPSAAFWRWLFIERRELEPWTPAPRLAPTKPPARSDRLQATWIGHATVLFQAAKLNFLTDPVYSETVNPVPGLGPRRAHPPGIAYEDLPAIDVVLLSHAHYDHLDDRTIRALIRDHDPMFVAGLGLARWLKRRGAKRVLTLDWWETSALPAWEAALATRITAVPAQHGARRGLFDSDTTLWVGYVIDTPAGRIYFAGDTGYDRAIFEQIRANNGAPDLALIPIGSYEPRRYMQRRHMNPAEAVSAFEALEARQAMGIHFGTFRLTDEAREQPPIDLAAALAERGIDAHRFIAPAFGETLTVDKRESSAKAK